MRKQPVPTCVALSDDRHFSLQLHRDHDFPLLDYTGAKNRRAIRLTSAALGRLLRELSPDLGLTVEVVKLQPIAASFPSGEFTAIIVRNGRNIIVAHLPVLTEVNDARRLLGALPELRTLAVGPHLLNASDEHCHSSGKPITHLSRG